MITVHAGQCGNQLGYCILDSLHDHIKNDSEGAGAFEQFFRRSEKRKKWVARSVCLDTEPKVIHECFDRAKQTKDWVFNESGAAYEHGGAGNNWAMGYQMCSGSFRDNSIDCIRRELEEVDMGSVIAIYHSIGGGTGSGLGTRITEEIRDEMSGAFIFNVAVMPYHFGEVVVQHYNSSLCLSKIAAASDAIMLFENEIAHSLCRTMRGIERPSLYDINRTITACTVPALLPKRDPFASVYQGGNCMLVEDIAHLCSHPNFKFIDIKSTPQTSAASVDYTYDNWSTILRTLERMDARGTVIERGTVGSGAGGISPSVVRGRGSAGEVDGLSAPVCGKKERGLDANSVTKNVAQVLTLHGMGGEDASRSIILNQKQQQKGGGGGGGPKPPMEPMTFSSSYAAWASVSPCKVYTSSFGVNGYQRSASLISNGQTVLPSLQRPLLNGANMFRSGAYVHQYQACGLETDDFVSAFRSLGQIVNNYNAL